MIIFFNDQPVTERVKVEKLFERAQFLYGSDFFNTQKVSWFGDNITVDSLFPSWIMKEYEKKPNSVLVIPIVKNYLRWLMSLEYGYGAQLNWENIRSPLFMNSIFLEALADFYFNGADFSSGALKSVLPNIRKFSIKCDSNYFNQKGTPEAIKYICTSLLGFAVGNIDVYTSNYGLIQINVKSSDYSRFFEFKDFLEEHVIPAGISVSYGVK